MQKHPSIRTSRDQGKTINRFFPYDVASAFFKPVVRPPYANAPSNDGHEREADAHVQRKETGSHETTASKGLEQYVSGLDNQGQPLPEAVRAFYEPHYAFDFSKVKIHTDATAAQSAQSVQASAYTSGNHIVFNKGQYAPGTDSGKRLLGHELTHVVQQSKSLQRKPIIQRSGVADFKTDLEGISSDHAAVVKELFVHPKFVPLIDYLSKCPAGTIDFHVARIRQRVRGALVDLFGGFSPSSGSGPGDLTVNPFRPEHASNPLELVDTIVHECIHAVLSLNTVCTSATNPFPLASDVLDAPRDPELAPVFAAGAGALERTTIAGLGGVTTASGANPQEYLQNNYGPSASRPQTHYVDMNRKGLELVTSIIADIKAAHPKIGKETVAFDNVELMQAGDLLATRSWLNSSQELYSSGLFKNQVAKKRNIDATTFTAREYTMSAIQVVEFADSRQFDPNTGGGWGVPGGVWQCSKRSRFTGQQLHAYVTGTASKKPGGSTDYKIIQHT
jgi:hypothetical protein